MVTRRNSTSSSATGNNASSSSASMQVPILAVVFAASGAALNLLQQQLFYAGAGDGSLLILIVPTFVGMIIGGLASADTRRELFGSGNNNKDSDNKKEQQQQQLRSSSQVTFRMKQILAVSIADVTSLTLRSMSQNLCGSGMFTVIYASLPAFNGVLSYFFLNRVLNKWQWTSMAVVVCGLAFSAEAEQDELSAGSTSSKSNNARAIHQVALGILLGLAGTLFSATSYVCAERVLKSPDAPRHPTTLTAINGLNDMLLTTPWLILYSIPHRQDLLYDQVSAKGQSPTYLAFLWLCLVAANAAHLNACYILLQVTESVTLTMLQGVRAVMVFAISGLLFCTPASPEQCLSVQKSLCSFVVLCGVVMYARSTAGLSKHMGSVGGNGGSNSSGSGSASSKTIGGGDHLNNNGGGDYTALQEDGGGGGAVTMMIEEKECPSSATKTTGLLEKRSTYSSRSSSFDSMVDIL